MPWNSSRKPRCSGSPKTYFGPGSGPRVSGGCSSHVFLASYSAVELRTHRIAAARARSLVGALVVMMMGTPCQTYVPTYPSSMGSTETCGRAAWMFSETEFIARQAEIRGRIAPASSSIFLVPSCAYEFRALLR